MLNLRFALLAALLLSGHYLVLARPQDASTNPDDTSTTESTTSTEATTILSSQEESTTTTEAATAATDAPTADISSSSAAPSNSAGVNDVTNGGGGYLPPSNGGGDAASPPIGGGYVAPPPPALPTSGYQPGRGAVSSAAAAAGGGRNAFASPGGYYPGLGAGGAGGGGASSAASSFGGGFNPYGGGGGGGYGAFNPFAFLFNFYRPPHIHQGGGIYINQCTGCQNYADAARDGAEELNDESACTGYIEKLQENDTEFESFLTPNKLKTKLDAMIAKKPGDITPAVVQCCYKVFPEQIAKATRGAKGINVKELKYTEPEGLEKGKTCKDMVHSFLKLLKGDYPQPKPGQAATDKNRTASKTVESKKQ